MKKMIYSMLALSSLVYVSCTKSESTMPIPSATVILKGANGSITMDTARTGRMTYGQDYYSFSYTSTTRLTNGTKNTLSVHKENTTESYTATLTKTALSGKDSTYNLEFLGSTFQ